MAPGRGEAGSPGLRGPESELMGWRVGVGVRGVGTFESTGGGPGVEGKAR